MSDVMRFRAWDPRDVNQAIMAVSASDYDALAADLASANADKQAYGQNAIGLRKQRDEGLAREADQKRTIDLLDKGLASFREEHDVLQHRLAEAEKLLRECNEGFKDFISDPFIRNIDAFLASPGCADGEKTEQPAPEKYAEVLLPFMALMTRELHANAAKGGRPAWLQMTPEQCLLEIYYHVSKLQKAVRDNDPVRVAENTADVANMAMMMADIFGLLGEHRLFRIV